MTNGNQLTREEQAWLVEYQACQSDNNALGNQAWISISILITVNLLLLGQVVYGIVLKSGSITECAELLLVGFLGLAMIIILWIFYRWKKRVDFQVRLNNKRMRDIEEELDFEMWKNWRVRGLDLYYGKGKEHKSKEWGKLNAKLKVMIKKLSKSFPQEAEKSKEYELKYEPPSTTGFLKFSCIFILLISLWVGVVFLEVFI